MSEKNELLEKTEQLIKMAQEAITREQEETDKLILITKKRNNRTSFLPSGRFILYRSFSARFAKSPN